MLIRAIARGPSQRWASLLAGHQARSSPPRRYLSSDPSTISSSPNEASCEPKQQSARPSLYSNQPYGLSDHNGRTRRDRSTRVAFAAELLKAGHFPGQIAEVMQKRLGTDSRLAVGTIRGYLIERARADPAFYKTVAFNWKRVTFEGGFLHDCETLEEAIDQLDEVEEHRRKLRQEYKDLAAARGAAKREISAEDSSPF